MAEDRIGAIRKQSTEAKILLDSDETKLHFQTSRSAIVYACASASENVAVPLDIFVNRLYVIENSHFGPPDSIQSTPSRHPSIL